jgi:hypothetical protein
MNKNFVTITELHTFVESVAPIDADIDVEEYDVQPTDETKVERFESWLMKPENIDESIINQLSDIQNKKVTFNVADTIDTNTVDESVYDQIIDSIAVAYITKDGIPVAFATLIDPTKPNWKEIIPIEYYSMQIGKPLDGRLEQKFFQVAPEYDGYGLSAELRTQLETIAPMVYTVIPSWDVRTITALDKNQYEFMGEFDLLWENYTGQLWIN